MSLSRVLSPVLLLTCISVVWAEAEPAASDLTDNAELFSKAAKEEVQPILKEIREAGRNLSFVIETAPAPVKANPTNAEYAKYATEKAKELKVKGVYLLVYKTPAHFELLADKKTTEKAFTDSDRNELSDLLARDFEKKDYDAGLKAGATFVRDRVKANLTRVTETAPVERGLQYWASLILILLVLVWLAIAAVRGVWNGGIGKGFMPAFMTALIGATVGLWLYENVISKMGGGKKSEDGDEYSGAGEGRDT